MNDRLLSILGLCRRAGKIVLGTDPVTESIVTNKAFAVIMAKDFSRNSQKGILKASHMCNVKTYVINRTKDELGTALGKYCAVAAITDRGFSDKIQELILKEQEQEEQHYDD
ncbi:MAG: ribosomal L7Ae/L30e/S12e/Gadd45 family protein [Oscillospiraceae bacterium]|nr:ribosomal L7Ae/L30e/S12e/Gadd45 family protein [Oscillospiraceae bacterium]